MRLDCRNAPLTNRMLVRASGFTAGLPSYVLCYENAAPERWIFVLGRKAYEHLSFEIE